MRRRGTKKLWVSVCAALMAAAVLSGCTKSGDGTKETSVKAAAETIKGPESGDKAGDKSEDKTAASAAYPEKEIQCIVTAAAGGGTDAMARAVCTPLEKTLGKAIVIINNGSASGLVGMGDIADADADGYTLGVFSNTDVANFVYGAGECDFTTEDFTYIAGLNTTGDILVLKKGTDMNGLEDFIQKAKEKPGEMTVALPSAIQNLSLDLMNEKMGIVTTGVVYEGGNKVLADLLGGHIEAGILSARFISQAQEQDLNVLGIMLSERLGTFPDVPTFAEQGYGIANPAIRMLVGPKGLPDSVVDVLVENLKQGYDGEIRDSVSGIDEEPALLTGPELDAFLKEDFAMRKAMLTK